MTINECITKKGWDISVESLKRFHIVHIAFKDKKGEDDSTSFDVIGVGTYSGIGELTNLWKYFCKENGFKTNSVNHIAIVASTDTMGELLEIDM